MSDGRRKMRTVMQRNPNFVSHFSNLIVVFVVVGLLQVAPSQNADPPQGAIHQGGATTEPSGLASRPVVAPSRQNTSTQTTSSAPVLGPGDEVEVTVYGAPDLSEHTRVATNGNISMPLVGYIRVAGLSSSEAEDAIEAQLRQNNVVNNPQVSVYVKEYTSGGISVAGEVSKPGVYSALGLHRLFDVLQAAGGLTDRAGSTITISHRDGGNPVTVEIPKDPEHLSRINVELSPGDTMVVSKAGIVYVLGEVNKPGGYVLNSTGGVTLLRVVAAAGGPTHGAAVGSTKMIRRTPTGLQEVPVPLKDLMHAKVEDIPVQAEDIVYVPSSRMKAMVNASALLSTLGTTALYRIPF
jgi:polysaccharide export outer membrane protein